MKTHQQIGLSISSLYTVFNLRTSNVSQSLCKSRPNPAAWLSDVGCYLQSGIMLEGVNSKAPRGKKPLKPQSTEWIVLICAYCFFFLMFNMKSVGGKHLISNRGHIVVYKCFPPLSPHLTVHKEPSLTAKTAPTPPFPCVHNLSLTPLPDIKWRTFFFKKRGSIRADQLHTAEDKHQTLYEFNYFWNKIPITSLEFT